MTAEMQDLMSAEIRGSSDIVDLLYVLIWGNMIIEDGAADLEECRSDALKITRCVLKTEMRYVTNAE